MNKKKTRPAQSIEVVLIAGPQGSGKTTLARYFFGLQKKRLKAARPMIYSPAGDIAESVQLPELIAFAAEKADAPAPNAELHTLWIDEADTVDGLLDTAQRAALRRYWATARHAGLLYAIFVARRIVEIPTYIRNSATKLFVSSLQKEANDLKVIRELGGHFWAPGELDIDYELGDFQDVFGQAREPGMILIERVSISGGTANLERVAPFAGGEQ